MARRRRHRGGNGQGRTPNVDEALVHLVSADKHGRISEDKGRHSQIIKKVDLRHLLAQIAQQNPDGALRASIDGIKLTGNFPVVGKGDKRKGRVVIKRFFNMEGLNCPGLLARNCAFTATNFKNANLSGADLRGTHFSDSVLYNADLSNARLDGSVIRQRDIRDLKNNKIGPALSGANLTGANLDGTIIDRAAISSKNPPQGLFNRSAISSKNPPQGLFNRSADELARTVLLPAKMDKDPVKSEKKKQEFISQHQALTSDLREALGLDEGASVAVTPAGVIVEGKVLVSAIELRGIAEDIALVKAINKKLSGPMLGVTVGKNQRAARDAAQRRLVSVQPEILKEVALHTEKVREYTLEAAEELEKQGVELPEGYLEQVEHGVNIKSASLESKAQGAVAAVRDDGKDSADDTPDVSTPEGLRRKGDRTVTDETRVGEDGITRRRIIIEEDLEPDLSAANDNEAEVDEDHPHGIGSESIAG